MRSTPGGPITTPGVRRTGSSVQPQLHENLRTHLPTTANTGVRSEQQRCEGDAKSRRGGSNDTVTVVAASRAAALWRAGCGRAYHGARIAVLTNITRKGWKSHGGSLQSTVIGGSRRGHHGVRSTAHGRRAIRLIANQRHDGSVRELNAGVSGAVWKVPLHVPISVIAPHDGYVFHSGSADTRTNCYDVSDRPRLWCPRVMKGPICQDVVHLPQPPDTGQLRLQDRNGTLRWENLTKGVTDAGKSDRRHRFYFEAIASRRAGDTLEDTRFPCRWVGFARWSRLNAWITVCRHPLFAFFFPRHHLRAELRHFPGHVLVRAKRDHSREMYAATEDTIPLVVGRRGVCHPQDVRTHCE